VCGDRAIPGDETSFPSLKAASEWFHKNSVLQNWGCRTAGTRPQIVQAATVEEAKAKVKAK
jgi:hypothetical protein